MGGKLTRVNTPKESAAAEQAGLPTGEPGSWNKTCKKCGNRFIAMRSNAVYCSSSCKVLDCIKRKALFEIADDMPERTLKECHAKLRAYRDAHS